MKKIYKNTKILAACICVVSLLASSGCQGGSAPADPEALLREARTNANSIANCTATLTNSLNFTVDGKSVVYQTAGSQTYFASPYCMKNTLSSQLAGEVDNTLTYTMTESDGVWFYGKNADGVWKKSKASGMGTTPLEQLDILRLVPSITGQKYVRAITLNSQKAHKLEVTFNSEVLRSMLETIVTASGLGNGSETIVSTLLEGAPEVYGYCYVSEDAGQILRLELDATEALNTVFQKIDGASVQVTVSKAVTSGDLSNIGKAETITLPEETKSAEISEAVG